MKDIRIDALGDSALRVGFGSEVDAATTALVQGFAQRMAGAPLRGVRDVVPAYTTVTLHYRPEQVASGDTDLRPAFERLREQVAATLDTLPPATPGTAREVVVPVWYGGDAGPDLDSVAGHCSLSPDEVVARHVASAHRVCMLGFAPGFPFITGLDPALRTPRRATPRTHVPPGSVAIAREQTCIYPLDTPGGWNLIGRTPLVLFNPADDPPSRLRPGDRLRFEPITAERFYQMADDRARTS